MEGVLQALKRMHGAQRRSQHTSEPSSSASIAGIDTNAPKQIVVGSALRLDRSTLTANRIVAFDSGSDQTRPYDVLRNLVLDDLSEVGSRTIAVTSPTKGCGVTVTAANLAFSIARLRTTKVLLLDCNRDAQAIPQAFGKSPHPDASATADPVALLREVEVEGVRLYVGSAALISKAGREGGTEQESVGLLGQLKQQLGPLIVVLDLPPILTGDQTLPLVLGADLVLLVLAVGNSTIAELESCKTYLNSSGRVQVVLNKTRKHGL